MRSLVAATLVVASSADETSLMQDLVRRSSSSRLSANAGTQSTQHLLDAAVKMVKNGVTPDVIEFVDTTTAEIDRDVFPRILAEHDRDQEAINDLFDRFDNAIDQLRGHYDDLETLHQAREQASEDHKVCRSQEALICGRHRRCEHQLYEAWLIVKAREEEMREIHGIIHGNWCIDPISPGRRPDWIDYPSIEHCVNEPDYPNPLPEEPHMLSHCYNWEQTSEYPTISLPHERLTFYHHSIEWFHEYRVRLEAVREAWRVYNARLEHCEAVQVEWNWDDKREDCDSKQRDVNRLACEHAERTRHARLDFGRTWDHLVDDYESSKATYDLMQLDRIAEWETLTIVTCLLNHIHTSVEANLETGAPCPTIESHPEEVTLVIEDCHHVTRGCPWAWSLPTDRTTNLDVPDEWPVCEDPVWPEPRSTSPFCSVEHNAICGVNRYGCTTTSHLCLEYPPWPCEPGDERCSPPPPVEPPCTPAYVAQEQASFALDMQRSHTLELDNDIEQWQGRNYALSDYSTVISPHGWAGCAPPLVCVDCSEAVEPHPDGEKFQDAHTCHIHEEYLRPGESNADSFKCHDGSCVDISARCNGVNNCPDNSDEVQCNTVFGNGYILQASEITIDLHPLLPNRDICGFHSDAMFQCGNGRCIDKLGVCNDFDNCGDNSDEESCSTLQVHAEATSGREISVETLSSRTVAFHDRRYTFESLGSFSGKTLIKYSNDDKLTEHDYVMTKLRTEQPVTVYLVGLEGELGWLETHGWVRSALSGVSIQGSREILRESLASEWERHSPSGGLPPHRDADTHVLRDRATGVGWQSTRHKEWDPSRNTEETLHMSEVFAKNFPAGTISIPGNGDNKGAFLIFVEHVAEVPAPGPAPAPEPVGMQLRYSNPDVGPNGLCVSMTETRGAGCSANGLCVGHGNSDATLQRCDNRAAAQLWTFTDGQLRSSLFPDACLTVGSSPNHGSCEPFTLQQCARGAAAGRQQFTTEAVAGTTIWRNTATNLAIDSDSYRNTVDNWIWACPGRNTAKYFNLEGEVSIR